MAMSRKHYREVAELIKSQYEFYAESSDLTDDAAGTGQEALRNTAYGLASMFLIDNDRFDRSKFLEACGIK
jgi:hypothetical protein